MDQGSRYCSPEPGPLDKNCETFPMWVQGVGVLLWQPLGCCYLGGPVVRGSWGTLGMEPGVSQALFPQMFAAWSMGPPAPSFTSALPTPGPASTVPYQWFVPAQGALTYVLLLWQSPPNLKTII